MKMIEKLKEWVLEQLDHLKCWMLDVLVRAIRKALRHKPIVYLAGYISTGTNDKGEDILELCKKWRDWFKKECPDIQFIDPMDGEAIENLKQRGLISDLPARAILEKDRMAIRKADMIVANLDTFGGSRPMIGTNIESGWNDAQHKPLLILAEKADYVKHPFLIGMASIIDHRKTEIVRVLRAMTKGLVEEDL